VPVDKKLAQMLLDTGAIRGIIDNWLVKSYPRQTGIHRKSDRKQSFERPRVTPAPAPMIGIFCAEAKTGGLYDN
jgi:hypothetical protein